MHASAEQRQPKVSSKVIEVSWFAHFAILAPRTNFTQSGVPVRVSS